jgi:aminoglycoside phosphotransferase (APT) family kinase protein
MNKLWNAEYPVSKQLAKELIINQFPGLKIESLHELGEGFDNTVFQLNQKYVFRFPRRDVAVELLKIENKLLPYIAQDLPLAIPDPVFFGQPSDLYPYLFTGYKLVAGGVPGKVSVQSRISSAKLLGEFLKTLHSIPITQAKALGVEPDMMNRMDLNKRIPMFEARLEELASLGFEEEARKAKSCLTGLNQSSLPKLNALVHGDIHIRNVIVNSEGVLSGIIDWGDVHIGDPAIDISFIYSFIPPEGRYIFFKTYGEVDIQTKRRALFKSIYTTVVLLLYGIDKEDQNLIDSARVSLSIAVTN